MCGLWQTVSKMVLVQNNDSRRGGGGNFDNFLPTYAHFNTFQFSNICA